MTRQGSHPRPASARHDGKPLAHAAVPALPAVAAPALHQGDRLEQEIFRLVEASREGRLSERGITEQFEGQSRRVIEGVNEMLNAILLPVKEGNRILAQISAGNIDELIARTYQGDHEKMKVAVNNVALVLQGLQKELGHLTEASRQGQLSQRGNSARFQGAYAEI